MIAAPKFVAMQSTRPQNVFWIHWNLSKRCNYNCTYCPDFLHDFTSPHRSLDNLISIAEKIKKNVPSEKFIRIWFTGGEPTANPNFLTFCKYLKENGNRHSWGIGRHILGSQVFDYWFDPYGFRVEHWTDGDLLNSDTPMGRSSLSEALKVQWGTDSSQRAT